MYDRDEVVDLTRKLQTTWAQRNSEYDLSRERYNGEHWDEATNPRPVNRYSLTLNYLKPFVDKSVQSLMGRLPAIQVMPSDTAEEARRHAEELEGVLYGTWAANNAEQVFQRIAWDSFVLRRGLAYIWWDPKTKLVCFKPCTPDHFYPEYDGEEVWRAVYVSRRNTERLKKQYPDIADEILTDQEMSYQSTVNDYAWRVDMDGQTTVYDVFDIDGNHTRVMGRNVKTLQTNYPFKSVPFIEFPCFPRSGMAEPLNMLDQLVELNQYLDQLVSQKADIISRYANPTILDFQSGQSAEDIRRAVSGQGAVIPVRRDGNIALLNWQGTVPAIDEQMTFVLDSLFDLAGKPRSAFGQSEANQSGVATNIALNPTIQSNESFESIWGRQLAQLNEYILMLWEEFMKGDEIEFKGRYRKETGTMKLYEVHITGKEIAGWTKNRIKWPSAIRTDDPMYVQNHLQQLQAQPFPAISLYTYLEEMGVEDVEAEIDRIGLQLEDPRFHPDRMTSAIDAVTQLQGAGLPGAAGAAPEMPMAPGADAAYSDSAATGGVVNQADLLAAKG